jgi:heterotetrameric sarcosine oxidase gamma subunit
MQCFPVDTVSRTVMEHLGVVFVRTGATAFQIMTPRSFASSLLHAIENVALHVHHERWL